MEECIYLIQNPHCSVQPSTITKLSTKQIPIQNKIQHNKIRYKNEILMQLYTKYYPVTQRVNTTHYSKYN